MYSKYLHKLGPCLQLILNSYWFSKILPTSSGRTTLFSHCHSMSLK